MAGSGAKVRKTWFVSRIRERGLSLRGVARLMKMDPGALSRTLNGERRMQVEEVRRIAEILEKPEGEVLAHLDVSNDLRRADLVKGSTSQMSRQAHDAPNENGTDAKAFEGGRHPGFGFMKGLIKIESGFDVTKPFDDEPWDRGYLGEASRK